MWAKTGEYTPPKVNISSFSIDLFHRIFLEKERHCWLDWAMHFASLHLRSRKITPTYPLKQPWMVNVNQLIRSTNKETSFLTFTSMAWAKKIAIAPSVDTPEYSIRVSVFLIRYPRATEGISLKCKKKVIVKQPRSRIWDYKLLWCLQCRPRTLTMTDHPFDSGHQSVTRELRQRKHSLSDLEVK